MTERERLIELLWCASRDYSEYTNEMHENGLSVDESYEEFATDYLRKNNVIILPYNLHLPKELYRHMFDNNKNKVVVKCKVGKNTGYGFTLVHYRDGREWEYKYTSIGKTVFLTKEEAEQALRKEQNND